MNTSFFQQIHRFTISYREREIHSDYGLKTLPYQKLNERPWLKTKEQKKTAAKKQRLRT